jgi:hypothetical protein
MEELVWSPRGLSTFTTLALSDDCTKVQVFKSAASTLHLIKRFWAVVQIDLRVPRNSEDLGLEIEH